MISNWSVVEQAWRQPLGGGAGGGAGIVGTAAFMHKSSGENKKDIIQFFCGFGLARCSFKLIHPRRKVVGVLKKRWRKGLRVLIQSCSRPSPLAEWGERCALRAVTQ